MSHSILTSAVSESLFADERIQMVSDVQTCGFLVLLTESCPCSACVCVCVCVYVCVCVCVCAGWVVDVAVRV